MLNDFDLIRHNFNGEISIDPKNNTVSQKTYTVISTVPWLNFGGYAAQKMLLPTDTCRPQKLLLSAKKNYKDIQVIW